MFPDYLLLINLFYLRVNHGFGHVYRPASRAREASFKRKNRKSVGRESGFCIPSTAHFNWEPGGEFRITDKEVDTSPSGCEALGEPRKSKHSPSFQKGGYSSLSGKLKVLSLRPTLAGLWDHRPLTMFSSAASTSTPLPATAIPPSGTSLTPQEDRANWQLIHQHGSLLRSSSHNREKNIPT